MQIISKNSYIGSSTNLKICTIRMRISFSDIIALSDFIVTYAAVFALTRTTACGECLNYDGSITEAKQHRG